MSDGMSLRLQHHIQEVIDLSELLSLTDVAWLKKASIQKLRVRLEKKQEEIDRCQKLLCSLYENLADGIRTEMTQAMAKSENSCAWMETVS